MKLTEILIALNRIVRAFLLEEQKIVKKVLKQSKEGKKAPPVTSKKKTAK